MNAAKTLPSFYIKNYTLMFYPHVGSNEYDNSLAYLKSSIELAISKNDLFYLLKGFNTPFQFNVVVLTSDGDTKEVHQDLPDVLRAPNVTLLEERSFKPERNETHFGMSYLVIDMVNDVMLVQVSRSKGRKLTISPIIPNEVENNPMQHMLNSLPDDLKEKIKSLENDVVWGKLSPQQQHNLLFTHNNNELNNMYQQQPNTSTLATNVPSYYPMGHHGLNLPAFGGYSSPNGMNRLPSSQPMFPHNGHTPFTQKLKAESIQRREYEDRKLQLAGKRNSPEYSLSQKELIAEILFEIRDMKKESDRKPTQVINDYGYGENGRLLKHLHNSRFDWLVVDYIVGGKSLNEIFDDGILNEIVAECVNLRQEVLSLMAANKSNRVSIPVIDNEKVDELVATFNDSQENFVWVKLNDEYVSDLTLRHNEPANLIIQMVLLKRGTIDVNHKLDPNISTLDDLKDM